MGYHIAAERFPLDDLSRRIRESDLVPSRAPLLDGLEEKLTALQEQGIATLADLRAALKSSRRLVGAAGSVEG